MAITKVTSGLISADASSIDLNIDAGTLYLDVSENRVGIGTTSPSQPLDVQSGTANSNIAHFTGSNSTRGMTIATYNADSFDDAGVDLYGLRELRFSTNVAEAMRIDSSGAIQIGGTSNAGFIDFDSTSLQLNTQRNPNTGAFVNTGKSHASIALRGDNGGSNIRFGTASANNTVATEAMRIDSSGNLLVGTTTAGTKTGDGIVGVGAAGAVINNWNSSVANNGTLDIAINTPGGGYQGFLSVSNTNVANAASRTQSTFSVFGRSTDSSIQQIATDTGTSAATFTVTTPSNGVIRVTNTSGATCSISMQFFGGTSG